MTRTAPARVAPAAGRTRPRNVYCIAPHKCGTKWLNSIFSDARVLASNGLTFQMYYPDRPLPPDRLTFGHIVSAGDLLAHAEPAGGDFRAVFVLRDPRDTCVSAYYSHRFSHEEIGSISQDRAAMRSLSARDGMVYIIRRMREMGVFACQRSYAELDDPRVRVFRFEDLIADNLGVIRAMIDHLGLRVAAADLEAIVDANRFEKRRQAPAGVVDPMSHYRRGEAGDWKNHFDPTCVRTFLEEAGDLLVTLGYEPDNDAWTRTPGLPSRVPEQVDERLIESRGWALRVLEVLSAFPGGRIVCYGAGSDFEQLCRWGGAGRTEIVGVVDDDPARHGRIVSGHRVSAPAELVTLDPDVIVVSSRAFGRALYAKARAAAATLPRRAEVWFQV